LGLILPEVMSYIDPLNKGKDIFRNIGRVTGSRSFQASDY
jgi:hypothetical protein